MKRNIFILLLTILLTSCWIEPKYGNYKYESNTNTYYFENMDTMCQILPAEINKKFTSWHWNSKVFKEKYYYYLESKDYNFTIDDDLYNKLLETEFDFIVKIGNKLTYADENSKTVSVTTTSFLIIRRNKETVAFFEK